MSHLRYAWGITFILGFLLLASSTASAEISYSVDLGITLSKQTYSNNESLVFSGALSQATVNNDEASNYVAVENGTINLSIVSSSNTSQTYTAITQTTTRTSGIFNGSLALAFLADDGYGGTTTVPATPGDYYLQISYTDPSGKIWYTWAPINIMAKYVDNIFVRSAKARYYPNETVEITVEATRIFGNSNLGVANLTLNGSMRYLNKTLIPATNFSCTTSQDGTCTVFLTAPAQKGEYLMEINDFMSTTLFFIIPFDVSVEIKDSTGENVRPVLSNNEEASIDVHISYNGTTAVLGAYYFNGTIKGAAGNVIKNITTTALTANNSYTNRVLFTIDSSFNNGFYTAEIIAFKEGGDNANATATFQIRSWTLAIKKSSENSGFQYGYSALNGKPLRFEVYPRWRTNGTLISDINTSSAITANLTDVYGVTAGSGAFLWNASCSNNGCYQMNLTAPQTVGTYNLEVAVNYSNEVLKEKLTLKVIDLAPFATPSTPEGELKELFGTNEFIYLTLTAENSSGSMNVTSANITGVVYEDGTAINYSETTNASSMNLNDTLYQWFWNATSSRLKLDTPKAGGFYTVIVSMNNNRGIGTAKIMVNPYDLCTSPKSTAGNVTSGNYYTWQFKTSDPVYVEIKIKEATNPKGRYTGDNFTSTYRTEYYGMGNSCYFNTATNKAVTNATISIGDVTNIDAARTVALNTTSSVCKADDATGSYTCTIIPATGSWEGGRYKAVLRVTGQDNQTTDVGYGTFEARPFYLWAWTTNWQNKPTDNVTLRIQMYQAGTSWWSNYGSSGGLGGTVTVEKIRYNGVAGAWLWPPIDYAYNLTVLNASVISGGNGNITLPAAYTPDGTWKPGSYTVLLKGTSTSTGESDYREAWFEIRQWDAYASPVTTYSDTYQWKSSFNVKDNITLFVKISQAGDYTGNGGSSLGGNVRVGVKALQDYTKWPPTEVSSSVYTATPLTLNTSSPWYSSASQSQYAGYILTIIPTNGRWTSGYYNVVLDINGTETGWGWFNAIAFYANAQPTNSTGGYLYSTNGHSPVYFNITTTKSQKDYYSSYTSLDYLNTTVKDVVLRIWDSTTYQQVEYNYPDDFNISPLRVNGSGILNFSRSGNWRKGYYSGEITLQDNENSTTTAYLWFEVKPFRVDAVATPYTIGTTANATTTISIYNPDWSSNTLLAGNYSIVGVIENSWSYYGNTITSHNYTPIANTSFGANTTLRVVPPAGGWTVGWKSLTVMVRDNADNSTQEGWISFQVVPFSVNVSSVSTQNSLPTSNNVTVTVSLTNPGDNSLSSGYLLRLYEWDCQNSCTLRNYPFKINSCTSWENSSCLINGTQNMTLVVPSGGWAEGYHYLTAEYGNSPNATSTIADYNIWFKAVKPYDWWYSNVDENGNWNYYIGFTANATFKIYIYNGSQNWPYSYDAVVNVTSVQISEDGTNCWSDWCRNWTTPNWTVVNSNSTINGIGTLKIINAGTWQRGNHAVKINITGTRGSTTLQTLYFYAKDLTAPTITVLSPTTGMVITNTTFLFNATTTEDAVCYLNLINHNTFRSWYCSGNSTGACNSTRWPGSTYFYKSVQQYVTYSYGYSYGDQNFTTGGQNHAFLFNGSALGMTNQGYGLYVSCYDTDWNYVYSPIAFTYNVTEANITSLHAEQEAYVASSLPTTALGVTSEGYVGATEGTRRTFAKFRLPPRNNPQITSATVQVDYKSTADAEVTIHNLMGDWDESNLVWNNQPPFNATAVDSKELDKAADFTTATWNITSLVQQWYNDPQTNKGLAILLADESSNAVIQVEDIILEVRYS